MEILKKTSPAQWRLIFVIIALTIASLAYRLLSNNDLAQTAALFIGLPATLAIIFALTPQAKTVTGMILKGLTIALLMAGVLLPEGFICILMAAPIFYFVGAITGWAIDRRRKRQANPDRKLYSFLVLAIVVFSLEGTVTGLSYLSGLK